MLKRQRITGRATNTVALAEVMSGAVPIVAKATVIAVRAVAVAPVLAMAHVNAHRKVSSAPWISPRVSVAAAPVRAMVALSVPRGKSQWRRVGRAPAVVAAALPAQKTKLI